VAAGAAAGAAGAAIAGAAFGLSAFALQMDQYLATTDGATVGEVFGLEFLAAFGAGIDVHDEMFSFFV
jgi:hypothetical protein